MSQELIDAAQQKLVQLDAKIEAQADQIRDTTDECVRLRTELVISRRAFAAKADEANRLAVKVDSLNQSNAVYVRKASLAEEHAATLQGQLDSTKHGGMADCIDTIEGIILQQLAVLSIPLDKAALLNLLNECKMQAVDEWALRKCNSVPLRSRDAMIRSMAFLRIAYAMAFCGNSQAITDAIVDLANRQD